MQSLSRPENQVPTNFSKKFGAEYLLKYFANIVSSNSSSSLAIRKKQKIFVWQNYI